MMCPKIEKNVPKENEIFTDKAPKWFDELYELQYEFKSYLAGQKAQGKIIPNAPLSVDQGLVILNMINKIDAYRLTKFRSILFVITHPESFEDKAVEQFKRLSEAFRIIDAMCIKPYEKLALDSLEDYIRIRRSQVIEYAFDDENENDLSTITDESFQNLKKEEPIPIDKSIRARNNWRYAISKVLDQNRINKISKTSIIYQKVRTGYDTVDMAVRDEIKTYLENEYNALKKLQEAFNKWLDVFELIVKEAEKDIGEIGQNMDELANFKAQMAQMLLHGILKTALTPFLLSGFVDPAMQLLNQILNNYKLHVEDVNPNLTIIPSTYILPGILPDPTKKNFQEDYKKISEETVYESLERLRLYLAHRLNSLSETRELVEMMSEDSKFWGEYTTKEIMEAHRMRMIDHAHYVNKKEYLQGKNDENSLKLSMIKPFKETISQVFGTMKLEYGSSQNLEQLHRFIDLISFDDNLSGPDAHKKSQSNQLISELSNHLEIYYIVRCLVRNSKYFGGKQFRTQLQHNTFKVKPEDRSLGLSPDNDAISELVMVLLERIMKTKEDELKKELHIDPLWTKRENLKHNPLVGSMFFDKLDYKFTKYNHDLFHKDEAMALGEDHKIRRAMIQKILDHYYNLDISTFLQNRVLDFAKRQGITLNQNNQNINPDKLEVKPEWMSQHGLRKIVDEKFKPYKDEAAFRRGKNESYGSLALHHYKNAQKIEEAKRLRVIELDSKKKTRVAFKN